MAQIKETDIGLVEGIPVPEDLCSNPEASAGYQIGGTAADHA